MTADPEPPATPRIRPVGPHAILVELPTLEAVRAYSTEVERRRQAGRLPSVVDVVPAARTLLLDGVENPAVLARDLLTWQPDRTPRPATPIVVIPTVYDGPDLPAVARQWEMTPQEVVALHTSLLHEAAFMGFAPGFAYLAGLPEANTVTRRPRPRTAVPAGSVALAGAFSGIYPRASPGGWQLIGRTRIVLWQPECAQPALLTAGTRVRFTEIPA